MLISKDIVAIDLSSNDLKIAQMSFSPARREITSLVTGSIQNLSEEDISG